MAWAPLLLVVLAYSSGSLVQAALTQTPSVLSAKPGDTVTITCSGLSNYYGWFQQKVPGSAPVTVIYANTNRPLNIPSRFSGSKSGSTGTLTITGVQAEDEAVYYCGNWDSSISAGVFGEGTRLSVIDQPKVAPTVYVFPPSNEEFLEKNTATVVCLIGDFYPGTISVSWEVDGQIITSGVETGLPHRQSNKQYLASSYLTLSSNRWQSGETYTCKVTHEAGNVVKSLKRSEC
ncbi:immunoglobulin lambda-1 light chain isoform X2 [Calypte anna]|uniref:immunoglobulin lambda-1 light chain isoform X2 n=1 Tax=Calypte anna TaxID=9244 RepID=UPI0011C4428B|nr:immunoglobulin lambda-1 light chain isoform X2 [Calypte anna]